MEVSRVIRAQRHDVPRTCWGQERQRGNKVTSSCLKPSPQRFSLTFLGEVVGRGSMAATSPMESAQQGTKGRIGEPVPSSASVDKNRALCSTLSPRMSLPASPNCQHRRL